MKFTIIGQACLVVESGQDRLVIDPWILGSCYWRSWWHFPPARPELLDPESVSAVYLTHEHPDHLHFPSLRRFSKDVRILVPRFPVDRMATVLRERGFTRVEELPHSGRARIGSLQIASYQAGTDDSIVVVDDGTTTILNMNDAKAGVLALRHILRRHPRIDFFLRSHAPAQAYPYCYTADDPRDLKLLTREHYLELFAASVRVIRPRWAVPFASNICHLHPESREQNANLIAPDDVVDACRDRVGESQVLAMSPGDSWSRDGGFVRALRPTRGERARALERLADDTRERIGQAVAEEQTVPPVDFATFGGYVGRFLRSVPWPLRRAFPARVAFKAEAGYFVVDVGRGRVRETATLPLDAHSIVRANLHMLRDAIEKGGLNLVGISRRIRVHLRRGGATCDAAFWGLLTVYELGYLPLRNVVTLRGLATLLARWRELIGYVPIFLSPGRSLERVIASKAPGESERRPRPAQNPILRITKRGRLRITSITRAQTRGA